MKIIYGKKNPSKTNEIFLDESDISIPTGKTFHELPVSILKKIEKQQIYNKEIYTIFNYSNISLWWFIYPTIFASFARTIFFTINFEKIIKKEKPTEIKVIGDFNKLDLIKQICKKNEIKFSYSKNKYFRYIFSNELKSFLQPLRYYYITKTKKNKRLLIFKKSNKSLINIKDKIVFFVPTSYRRNIYDFEKNQIVRGEYLIETIIKLIKKIHNNIAFIDVDYSFKGDPEILSERLQTLENWFPTELLFNTSSKKTISKFLKNYKKIINDENFQKFFTFRDINIWKSLEFDFNMLSYKPYIPTYIEMYESFKKLFINQKPKIMFIPYETGPFALSLICACIENNIKTVGIQHGGLIVKHPDYIHDIFKTSTNLFGMPIPDSLLVFGEYYKNELIQQANYPAEKIIVFGNPLYFDLEKILENLNSDEIKKKYNIPLNKKIILFTSALFQKYYSQGGLRDYDERILEELTKKFYNNNDCIIIIKPHPSEHYIKSYQKIINANSCSNFIIKQGDLFELIQISDVVLSFFSTSLIDSIMFNKPTIRLTFPGTEVPTIFKDKNIFLESSLDSLEKNILDLLGNDQIKRELLKHRDKFLRENYNIPNPDSLNQLKLLLGIK